MTQSMERWLSLGVHPPLDAVRRRKLEATQALLGDTIGFSDADWRAPSLVPGWSRAHVASHLARNAEALRRVLDALFVLHPQPMYPERDERLDAIEEGARRSGLELQIDLDTTADELATALDAVEAANTQEPVALTPRLVVPAPVVALARLSEVVLHHIDLDTHRTVSSLEPEVATWLAAWELFRGHDDPRLPSLHVHTDSGLEALVGPSDQPATHVSGPDADIVRWLSGRGDAVGLHGVDGLPPVLAPR